MERKTFVVLDEKTVDICQWCFYTRKISLKDSDGFTSICDECVRRRYFPYDTITYTQHRDLKAAEYWTKVETDRGLYDD